MSELLAGDGWYAVVKGRVRAEGGFIKAPSEHQDKMLYAQVIAWERGKDDAGKPRLVAWIQGREPVRSDAWETTVLGYKLLDFTTSPPADFEPFSFGL